MARSLFVGLGAALLAGCAALAGIGDAPSDADASAEGGVESGVDASPPADAARADAAPPVPSTASIAVRCNGTVLSLVPCANKRWEYDFSPCAGSTTKKVLIENNGMLPVAFIARSLWSQVVDYVPNQKTDGQSGEMVGVLDPGAKVDISPAYAGGIFALVGSVRPFDLASLTAPKSDEGKTATKQAMLGTYATNGVLDVAELTASTTNRCVDRLIVFKKN